MTEKREKQTMGKTLKEISKKAMEFVKSYERERIGKEPDDVSSDRVGYDIKSGDRNIEVKGQEWIWERIKSSFLYISPNEIAKATHLYIVGDIFGIPELHIFEFSKIPLKALSVEVKYVLHIARSRDYEIKE